MKQKHQIYLVAAVAVIALGLALWSAYTLQTKPIEKALNPTATTTNEKGTAGTGTNTGANTNAGQEGGQAGHQLPIKNITTKDTPLNGYGGKEMPININALIN